MNCLEFRRIALSEPDHAAPEYAEHRDSCEECARFVDGVIAMDSRLGTAMQIPVPEDLTARIKLRRIIQDEQQDSKRIRAPQYALAASLFAVVTLAGFFGYQAYEADQMSSRIIASAVDHTRIERQNANHFVIDFLDPQNKRTKFKQVLAAYGGKVMDNELDSLGEIVHVQVCELPGIDTPVAHAVIKGAMGEISVYYIVGGKLHDRKGFQRGNFDGMLVPVGRGNLALVGEPGEKFTQIADRLEQSIVWQI